MDQRISSVSFHPFTFGALKKHADKVLHSSLTDHVHDVLWSTLLALKMPSAPLACHLLWLIS